MVATIINGKEIASKIRIDLKNQVIELSKQGIIPNLSVVLVGENAASKSYVKGKEKAAKEVGILSSIIHLPETVNNDELLQVIHNLNSDERIHGILVQLPLPAHINTEKVIESIDPKKDVDGFHPINIGKLMIGEDTFIPCTPFGILTLFHSQNIELEGKHVVVIGRSNIVGKPIGQLLLNENATVTYCHSKTRNLKEHTRKADILIVAIGKANEITADFIKEGAVVIDVGINRLSDGTLTGDVDFHSVKDKASYITPVPKGVGPMTIAMLLKNTVKAAQRTV